MPPTAAPPAAPLTHQAVKLPVPYLPKFAEAHRQVAADARIAEYAVEMRAVLEAPGDPEARLRALTALNTAGALALNAAGLRGSASNGGLDLVAADLRLSFLVTLAEMVGSPPVPVAQRREFLEHLLKLHDAPHPLGLPAPNERVPWTLLLQPSAEAEISALIEGLPETP